jgi:hypothetical protein
MDELDEEQEARPKKRRRRGGLFAFLLLLAAMAGWTWIAVTRPALLLRSIEAIGLGQVGRSVSNVLSADAPAVLASSQSAKEAAFAAGEPIPAARLEGFPDSAAGIDEMLQAGYLWQVVRAEFPEWYEERVRETARLVTEKRPDDAITKYLIDSLVALRRKNAEHAFAASLPKLQQVARRFRDSLDILTKHSQLACFSLISNGEGTKGMIGLFRDPAYGPTLQAGLAAVFEAIADGRRSPNPNIAARRSDYDALTKELTALGWQEADLNLFADSQELAKSTADQVCRMVREWFTAHLALPDNGIQRRLLIESVRPVVAG